jgi:hypothetical protein
MEDSDPIANAIAPPQNESPEEREIRLQKERAAKQVSDAIDAELTREQTHEKKRPKPVKILLLGASLPTSQRLSPSLTLVTPGQSESGPLFLLAGFIRTEIISRQIYDAEEYADLSFWVPFVPTNLYC